MIHQDQQVVQASSLLSNLLLGNPNKPKHSTSNHPRALKLHLNQPGAPKLLQYPVKSLKRTLQVASLDIRNLNRVHQHLY